MTTKLPFCLPADITPDVFLQEYWQKKPLLIKNGLPSLVGMFEPTDVLDLAIERGIGSPNYPKRRQPKSVDT